MKTIIYSFIALFTVATLQAQKLTEKELLGDWDAVGVEIEGIIVNFKTNEVTFTQEMQEMLESSGEDIEAGKAMILESVKGQGFEGVKATFKPGLKSVWVKDGTPKEFDYKIVEENGDTFLERGDQRKMKAYLENGLLKLVLGEAQGQSIVMGFEKKK